MPNVVKTLALIMLIGGTCNLKGNIGAGVKNMRL